MKRIADLRSPLLIATLAAAACGRSDAAVQNGAASAARPAAQAPAAGGREVALEGASAAEGAAPAAAGEAVADAPASPSAAPAAGASAPAAGGTSPQPAPAAEAPGDDAGAEQILRRTESAYRQVRSMQADFVQDLRVPLLGQNTRSSGKLYQRRPDRFLMRFSDPAGDLIVADGRHFWMYYPSSDAKQVMKTSIAAGSEQVDLHRQFLSNPVERYRSRLGGEETVDGHRTHVITLVPRQASPYRQLRIWVDSDDYAVRRFEMTEENESVRRIEFRNLRRNVALPDALFAFSPPRGTQVFEQ